MKSCCFTGHRNIKITAELEERLRGVLAELINNGITDFYAGGAYGWDMICEEAVLRHRKDFPQIRLHLILPCCFAEQTRRWKFADKAKFHRICHRADSVEYISEHYYNGCMKARNQRLVDMADCCVCYYDKKRSASGTGQTVRLAQKRGIKIINFYSDCC